MRVLLDYYNLKPHLKPVSSPAPNPGAATAASAFAASDSDEALRDGGSGSGSGPTLRWVQAVKAHQQPITCFETGGGFLLTGSQVRAASKAGMGASVTRLGVPVWPQSCLSSQDRNVITDQIVHFFSASEIPKSPNSAILFLKSSICHYHSTVNV